MLKEMAIKFGWGMLVLGVLGFIPGITTDEYLFGIFHVNVLHNLLHIVTGLAALYLANKGEESAQTFFKVFGVVYAVLALIGFLIGDNLILGLITNNQADTWLNVVIAVVSLYLGFGPRKESSMQAA
jgi:hypothetical protein